MQQAIIIRVEPQDYDTWFEAHSSQEEARLDYGMTDGPFYRDANNPNIALVHLNVENLERAMEWFKSDAFQKANKRAGKVQREVWIGELRVAAPVA